MRADLARVHRLILCRMNETMACSARRRGVWTPSVGEIPVVGDTTAAGFGRMLSQGGRHCDLHAQEASHRDHDADRKDDR